MMHALMNPAFPDLVREWANAGDEGRDPIKPPRRRTAGRVASYLTKPNDCRLIAAIGVS